MTNEQLKRELNDLGKWWAYNHNKNMDVEKNVEFQDKFNQMTLRMFASMIEKIYEIEEDTPKIVLPTGLQLNDKLRA